MTFHGDKILQQMVSNIINKLNITSFLETGTHKAETTIYVASQYKIPIFTCEIDQSYFLESKKNLANYPAVDLSQESSEKYIDRLIVSGKLGAFPMFFLDAHWFDYWPLLDEVKNISKLSNFVILIDDFAVTGHPQFESDNGGGGSIGVTRTVKDNRPCGMALIGSILPLDCEVGYPNYNKVTAYGRPDVPHLRGHVFIVRGAPNGFNIIKSNPYYNWGGIR